MKKYAILMACLLIGQNVKAADVENIIGNYLGHNCSVIVKRTEILPDEFIQIDIVEGGEKPKKAMFQVRISEIEDAYDNDSIKIKKKQNTIVGKFKTTNRLRLDKGLLKKASQTSWWFLLREKVSCGSLRKN